MGKPDFQNFGSIFSQILMKFGYVSNKDSYLEHHVKAKKSITHNITCILVFILQFTLQLFFVKVIQVKKKAAVVSMYLAGRQGALTFSQLYTKLGEVAVGTMAWII